MYEVPRQELIEKLRKKGIEDEKVLNAINKVERHLFVPKAMEMHAYKDIALPIGFGQTISQPYTVAYMTQLLNVNQDDKILEIGTGSGYQAAVLYEMGARVFTIERNFDLYNQTSRLFDKLFVRVHAKCGDGTIGWEEFAPYQGIIVTAGSPSVPQSLKKQLDIGGNLVIPVGDKKTQKLKMIKKIDQDEFEITNIPEFTFVPLIGREGWNGK